MVSDTTLALQGDRRHGKADYASVALGQNEKEVND